MKFHSLAASFLTALFLLAPLAVRADTANTAGATVTGANLFSYQAPPGWQVQNLPSATYPVALEMAYGAVEAMISVEVDHATGPLDDWSRDSLAKNATLFAPYGYAPGPSVPFKTAANADGLRTVITMTTNTKKLCLVLYSFSGSNDAKIVMTCNCAAEDADHYAPIFAAAAKTFVAP